MNNKNIKFLDTTLRDGEQTPGVALNPDGKLEIAKALDDLGVDIIEAGSAITSKGEREAIRNISREGLNAEICTYARGLEADIDAALECDVDSVFIVVPTSDLHLKQKIKKSRSQLKEMTIKTIQYARDHDLIVELGAEDATRTDIDFMKDVFQSGIDQGAERVCICDTVGIAMPEKIEEIVKELTKSFTNPVAVHCHDDFGVGSANTIKSVKAGAKEVHVTINGMGERAGNAALEEVALILSHFYKYDINIDLEKLHDVSKIVERVTGLPVSPTKAIVGDNAFSHEAGIHTHGVLAHPATYEPISPEMVGQSRRLVFGKHVGSHAIKSELEKRDLKPSEKQLKEIFERIKELGDRGKLVTDSEWTAIVDEVMGRTLKRIVELEELTVTSGNKVTPTASIKIRFREKEFIESGVGIGPVDAAMNAISKVVGEISSVKLQEYHVDAISGGTDSLVSVVVKLTDGKRIITSRGSSGDIIMASVQSMLDGVNRLLWDKKLGGGV